MVEVLPLQLYPNPILRQISSVVSKEELQKPEFSQLLLDMEKTMLENSGIGLAAPQVGRSIRVAIIKTEDGMLPLINPKILKRSWKKEVDEEGCLSIPKVYGDVRRSFKVKVSTITPRGEEVKFEATGLFARVIQHEIDHLNGVLFIDKAKKITGGKDILDEMKKNGETKTGV